ncbi:xanthine dehydrogenase family protein molybdopterin-binding subunit, partial [Chloroflexota bacterium]
AGEPSNVGLPIQSTALAECIRVGAERMDWKEKRARKKGKGVTRRGVGMATMSHISGVQPAGVELSGAFIKLNEDGSADLVINPGDTGMGSCGALAQIAAEELGLRAEDIHIVTGDTDITMFDHGSVSSRAVYITGNAVLRAAREARVQLLERAAKTLMVSADGLEIKDRRIYMRAAPKNGLSVAEVAHDAIYGPKHESSQISGKCSFEPTTASPPTQASFAEVKVDTETGEVTVLRMIIANDSGRAINPTTVEGQLEGGAVQGIGFGLVEDFVINRDTGVVESNSFTTYKIPSTLDIPALEVVLVEKPDPVGPFGAKGVGEAALVTVAPAIANAIYNAVGVRVTELPITPEKILKALKARMGI